MLQDIFEANLQLFGKKLIKKLVFIVRDFSERENDAMKLKEKLFKEIREIWVKIHKPDEFKNTTFEEVFDLEVELIPYFTFDYENFVAKIN